MTQYITYFNQQWVGDHTSEWFASRGPLARAVVAEMKAAGVLIFAGGLEEEIESASLFAVMSCNRHHILDQLARLTARHRGSISKQAGLSEQCPTCRASSCK